MQINDEYQLLHIRINSQLILPFDGACHSWPYKPTYRKCIRQIKKKTQWIFAPSNQTRPTVNDNQIHFSW